VEVIIRVREPRKPHLPAGPIGRHRARCGKPGGGFEIVSDKSERSGDDPEAVVSEAGDAAYFLSGGVWQLLFMNRCQPKIPLGSPCEGTAHLRATEHAKIIDVMLDP
jgi:hypothetical protein